MSANHTKNNELRRQAVLMRLDGKPLKEISSELGLSAPTIISAHKAYLASGWAAVDAKPRGRQHGDSSISATEQERLKTALGYTLPEAFNPEEHLWDYGLARQWLLQQDYALSERSALSYFKRWGLDAPFPPVTLPTSGSQSEKAWLETDYPKVLREAKSRSSTIIWGGFLSAEDNGLFFAHTLRKTFRWIQTATTPTETQCIDFLQRVLKQAGGHVTLLLRGLDIARVTGIQRWLLQHADSLTVLLPDSSRSGENPAKPQRSNKESNDMAHSQELPMPSPKAANAAKAQDPSDAGQQKLSHLQRLEAESIHIMREVVAEADNPVMLYSGGKDSAVMLHLAIKAFYPALPPFPLLHIDTGWKFRTMVDYREKTIRKLGLEMLTHTSAEGLEQGVNPFTHGTGIYTEIMKTDALKQALDRHRFDVALGGARRDEEKARSKERVFSFRGSQHRWNPKDQRPECWHLYNGRKSPGETIRAFPLANWTELDIWQYIHQQGISVVPLYFAAERSVVDRDGLLIVVDDERMPLHEGEVPTLRQVRFRSLGCYPLTGAMESSASKTTDIIRELLSTRTSERQGRMIDHDAVASMEKKKHEGYF